MTFDAIRKVALGSEGYSIERLSTSLAEEGDSVDLYLRWGPDRPDVVLSFQNVHYLEVGRLPGAGAAPLSEVAVTVIEPSSEPWPAGLNIDLVRSPALPALVWLHAAGPVQLNIVAAIATAYEEVG